MLASRIRVSTIATLVILGAAALAFGENADNPPASKKVNINTASVAELAYLPRIGTKVAERIVERRKEKPFARPEELMEVKGVGEKLFLSLKPYVTVTGPTTLDAKVRLSSSSSARRASSPAPAAKEKPANAVPSGKGR
jgi:competence protein ComEA